MVYPHHCSGMHVIVGLLWCVLIFLGVYALNMYLLCLCVCLWLALVATLVYL